MPRITDSNSRNAVSNSSACTMKRFPSSRCASAIQIVRPFRSMADTQPQLHPALLRLSAMIRQHGNGFVRPLSTPSSVIPKMRLVPNPCCRNERPAHCDGGIHHVWPFKFGAEFGVFIIYVIAPCIPRQKKKPAEQHHQLLPRNFPKFTAGILRIQNQAPKQNF
jgi:hypothetical protein